MDLELLRGFLALFDSGKVTAASQDLNISQPALTRRIQKLERRLGLRLFTRVGRSLEPTPAATAIEPMVRDLLARVSLTSRAIDSIADGDLSFRVSCPEKTVRAVVAPFVAETGAPIESTTIDVGVRVYDAVLDKRVDIALSSAAPPTGLTFLLVAETPVTAQMLPSHRLAHSPSIDATDLANEPLYVIQRGSGLRQVVDDALAAAQVTATLAAEPESSALAQALAASHDRVCLDIEPAPYGLAARPLTANGSAVSLKLFAAWDPEHFAARRLHDLATDLRAWFTPDPTVSNGSDPVVDSPGRTADGLSAL